MTGKWTIDEYWNVFAEDKFFNVSNFQWAAKREDDNSCSLDIGIGYCIINFGWLISEKENRDSIFDTLITWKKAYQKACKDHDELHHQMQAAQLDISNKTSRAFIDHTKEHS